MKNECKKCKVKLVVDFEGDIFQYPVFKCPECGDFSNQWEQWWEKYEDLWKEKENWSEKKHQPSCILGYFIHKFKDHYGFPFTVDYSNPTPYRNKDFTMIRRLLTMFEGNANDVRVYVKWMFEKKIKPNNKKVTSLGFFTLASFVNEFKQAKAKAKKVTRTKGLPADFIQWCQDNQPEIFDRQELQTWNDLNGLVGYAKSYGVKGIEGEVLREAVRRKMLSAETEYRRFE